MKKLIGGALLAATLLPGIAQAQSRDELRRDRQDIREQQRDVRDARREYREDLADRNRRFGDNDWQDWRNRNRGLYARGDWRAPFRYQQFRPGVRIAPSYFGPRYVIADPWRYHLPPARPGLRWVRHYNDMLLVDARRGVVVRVLHNFYY